MMTIHVVAGHDGYPLSVRVWQPREAARAQAIVLHGVVSHSEWLAPIAERLADAGICVICPDRRGAGLNSQDPGDAPSVEALVEDLDAVVAHFNDESLPRHLVGFCWGANYAISYLGQHSSSFHSLVLIAPGVFTASDLAEQPIVEGDDEAPTETPVIPLDRFTRGPDYEDYILPDSLRTRLVSKRFNRVMSQIGGKVGPVWANIRLPTLMILATQDRVSDNDKLARAFRVLRASPKSLEFVDSEHGIQFDAPDDTANLISSWIEQSSE